MKERTKVFLVIFALSCVCLTVRVMTDGVWYAKFIALQRIVTQKTDEDIANERMKEFLDLCKKQDKNGLKKLFAADALAAETDMDAELDTLFSFFQGKVLSYELDDGFVANVSTEFHDREFKQIFRASFEIETDQKSYRVAICDQVHDTKNPENKGIYSLYIIKTEDADERFTYWGDGKWTPGINIEDPQ